MTFGPWMMSAFGCWRSSSSCAARRSTSFGYSQERRTERKLVADYEAMLDEMLAKLNAGNHPLAVGLAAIPEKIRGFGHVKARHLDAAKADEAALLEQFRSGDAAVAQGRGVESVIPGGWNDLSYRPKPIFFSSRSFAAISRARRSPNTLRSA